MKKAQRPQNDTDPDDPVVDPAVLAELDSVEERNDLRGKNKMSRAKRAQLYKTVQSSIQAGLHPRAVRDACIRTFSVSRHTVDKYLKAVQNEAANQSGYYASQVREVVQRQLMTIVNNPASKSTDITRAAAQLGEMFDLRQTQEDTKAMEERLIEEHMQRMDEFTVQELQNYIERLRNKKLSAEEFFLPWSEPDEKPKTKRRTS